MRYIHLLSFIFFLGACGGSLSDEQRKQIREGMEQQKIVKVSDAEILSQALQKGQAVAAVVRPEMDASRLDSLKRTYNVNIRFLVPGKSDARIIEQELIDAYVAGMGSGNSGENLQKLWTNERRDDYDSLLFTHPQLVVSDDGVEELQGIWNIYMARKDLVLAIARER